MDYWMGRIGKVDVVLKDKECNVEWMIENLDFLSTEKLTHVYYESPIFLFEDEYWWLEIFPNGQLHTDSDGYIDIQLIKGRSPNLPINVEFSFAFKIMNTHKYSEKHSTGIFQGRSVHGIQRLISRSDFHKRKSEFLWSSGFLTIICTIKIINSTGNAYNIARAECSHCENILSAQEISSYKDKCVGKCPEYLNSVLYQKWLDRECQTYRTEDETSLSEDFKEMLLHGLHHDLILKVGNKEFRAHQDVLCARSHVFKSMLSHDRKEKKSGVIDIPDCDPEAMEQLLFYIYTGKVDSLEQRNMLKIYNIADKYNMKGLRRECRAFIKKSLSFTNICDVIKVALNHTDYILLEYATEYFMINALDIMRTVEWQMFMKDNSTVANELTIKSFEKIKIANT